MQKAYQTLFHLPMAVRHRRRQNDAQDPLRLSAHGHLQLLCKLRQATQSRIRLAMFGLLFNWETQQLGESQKRSRLELWTLQAPENHEVHLQLNHFQTHLFVIWSCTEIVLLVLFKTAKKSLLHAEGLLTDSGLPKLNHGQYWAILAQDSERFGVWLELTLAPS